MEEGQRVHDSQQQSFLRQDSSSGGAAASFPFVDEDAQIVHKIASLASFLSDANNSMQFAILDPENSNNDMTPAADSWAVGVELSASPSTFTIPTPTTPALIAISPGATPQHDVPDGIVIDDFEDDHVYMDQILHDRRRKWASEKLAAAVFSHPRSLRSFCYDAYLAVKNLTNKSPASSDALIDPETELEPDERKRILETKHRPVLLAAIHGTVDLLFNNVPVSVTIDVIDNCADLALDTSHASLRVTLMTVNGLATFSFRVAHGIWDGVANFNLFRAMDAVISFQFDAIGKTSEVLVSGIQSVATGVGSASSVALHRLSAANLASTVSTGSLLDGTRRRNTGRAPINTKLLKKLSSINSAARVVMYEEVEDDTGGLSSKARHKVQKMMHYDVSLRPFKAVVNVNTDDTDTKNASIEDLKTPLHTYSSFDSSNSLGSTTSSPFICTPQSFPPTPRSRKQYIDRNVRIAEDVLYLAREKLRVHDGLHSEHDRTREYAEVLEKGERLAVFSVQNVKGIEFKCGQHIATKVGSSLYSTTRSFVPILRNCYVYFEMTVLPCTNGGLPTLSVGLSTEEMPTNLLVGAWQGSVGICSTGQILAGRQWYTPMDTRVSSYINGSTIGCLVCLDDGTAFETWDGGMVTALVTFNVDGQIVLQSMSAEPTPTSQPPSNEKLEGSMPTPDNDDQPSPILPVFVPSVEELYPTVTLHSPGTSVMCRFSASDILADSKESIGAPNDAIVYAVDGSVIFWDKEEEEDDDDQSK